MEKTREEILKGWTNRSNVIIGERDTNLIYHAMQEYSDQQNKELLIRVKELELKIESLKKE